MGVGFPEDLVEGVRRGVDLFDCVAPTRMGRNGAVFTADGRLNIKRAEFRNDPRPLDENCDCAACRRFSRAYIRHLFVVRRDPRTPPALAAQCTFPRLADARTARQAILSGTFDAWSDEWLARYHSRTVPASPDDPPIFAPRSHSSSAAARRISFSPFMFQIVAIFAHLLLHHHPPAAEAAEEARGRASSGQARRRDRHHRRHHRRGHPHQGDGGRGQGRATRSTTASRSRAANRGSSSSADASRGSSA